MFNNLVDCRCDIDHVSEPNTKVRHYMVMQVLPAYRNMLDQSIADLNETVAELQRKYQRIDSEGNEWKTRFVKNWSLQL